MSGRIILAIIITALLVSACGTSDDDNANRTLPTRVNIEGPSPAPTTTPANRLLNFWEPVDGVLPEDSREQSWRFAGQAGDQVRVRALSTEGITLLITLFDDGGVQLAQGDSVEMTLPVGGIYQVVVSGDRPGTYQLGLGYADRPNPTEQIAPVPEVVGVPTPTPPFAGTFISQLVHNTTVGGEMTGGDHLYTFEGEAGQFIQLDMNRVSGELDPVLTVYDPQGMALAYDDNSGGDGNALIRNLRLAVDGLYSVQVSGEGATGSYSVRLLRYAERAPVTPTIAPSFTPFPTVVMLTPAPAQRGNRLENHIPVRGSIDRPDGVAIHSFEAAAGAVIALGVTPVDGSALLPRVEVVNPDGLVIAEGNASTARDGGAVILSPVRADLAGAYQVFVTSEGSTTGAYLIGYGSGSSWQEVVRGQLDADQPQAGNIVQRGTRDIWTLPLEAGDIITAAVNPAQAGALNPILDLVRANDPDTVIAIDASANGDRNRLLSDVIITESGVYLLRVRASQAATTGAYTIIWRYVNRAPTPTPIPAVAFVLSTDDVVTEGDYRFYPFQGSAGQRINVRVIAAPESDLDPVAALIGPDGTELITADDSADDLNARFTFDLPADGTYNVRVNGYLSGGAFDLVVEDVLR